MRATLAAIAQADARSTTRILPAACEVAFQPSANRAEDALHGALYPLFHVALVDRTQPGRNVIAVLEVFRVNRAAFDRPQIRDAAQLFGSHVARRREGVRRQAAGAAAHEIGPDRE